ncbi:type II toxin-antitoxin system HicA family toxin [Patescibacteria group bacterium]|nr:type II toxin-antitoxin system HicA family toxin [Patescibacteria group bacterium]
MPKPFSGSLVIKILTSSFGFLVVSQKGSHVKLQKNIRGTSIRTIVPLHRELAHGTLRGILRLAKIEYTDFLKHL